MKKYFKPVDELTFVDDYMFGKVMSDPVICAGVIERLLKVKVGHIEYPELQKELKPAYESKGVRFDVFVKDSDRVFDVEIQTYTVQDLPKRSRYYQSMIDIDCLFRGQPYDTLPESYVIFICKDDPLGRGLPRYTFTNLCHEMQNFSLGDKTTKVLYNASAYDESDDEQLKAFLHFVCNNEADDDFTRSLAESIRATIKDEVFRKEYMSVNLHDYDIMQLGKREGREEGLEQGYREKALETARRMLKREKYTVEEISEITNLTLEEVLALKMSMETSAENNTTDC